MRLRMMMVGGVWVIFVRLFLLVVLVCVVNFCFFR